VTRVLVLGGKGLFGRTIVTQLQSFGIIALTATRSPGADIQVDANDAESIRRSLRADDLVIDAAGPFQQRSLALLETAIDIGFNVIDLNDYLGYAEKVLALEARIANIA